MKNFQFLSNDVCLLKLSSNKGYDIDCFAMKLADTINNYDDIDYKFNFLSPKYFQYQYTSTITFCVYGNKIIKNIQNLKDEVFTLYYTNAIDFNEDTIGDRKFTCSNISYVKCYETKIANFNLLSSDFCTDARATFTVDFLWYENIYGTTYCGHSYDKSEIFNRNDIVSIFNINPNNSNEECIFEEIPNDIQKCLNKEITEKIKEAFEDTANSLLTPNLMLM